MSKCVMISNTVLRKRIVWESYHEKRCVPPAASGGCSFCAPSAALAVAFSFLLWPPWFECACPDGLKIFSMCLFVAVVLCLVKLFLLTSWLLPVCNQTYVRIHLVFVMILWGLMTVFATQMSENCKYQWFFKEFSRACWECDVGMTAPQKSGSFWLSSAAAVLASLPSVFPPLCPTHDSSWRCLSRFPIRCFSSSSFP